MSSDSVVQPNCETSERNRGYGWGSVRPQYFQFLNTTKWLLTFMCMGRFASCLASTAILPTIVTTISKRFAFSNVQIGFLGVFNDILTVFVVGFYVYYGERGHKGQWIGWGILVVAVGALILTMPQWTSKPWIGTVNVENQSTISDNGNEICNSDSKHNSTCDRVNDQNPSSWTSAPYLLFLLGDSVLALGSIPIDYLGITYMDENVTQQSSALYLTFAHLAAVSAILFGYLIASATLSIPGDGYRLSASDVQKSTHMHGWYGAWWIGYLIAACLACFAVVPLLGYPLELPAKEYHRSKDTDMTHKGDKGGTKLRFGMSWTDIPRGLKTLALNPTYVVVVLKCALQMMTLSGIIMFMPMYYQNAFNESPGMAATYSGLCSIIPTAVGGFIGAGILKWRKLSVRLLLLIVILVECFTSGGLFCLLAGCKNDHIAGANSYYNGSVRPWSSDSFHPEDSCNQKCTCGSDRARLVCNSKTNMLYYSPCRAGCTDQSENGSFLNCNCLDYYETISSQGSAILIPGICPKPEECGRRKIVVLTIFSLIALLGGISIAPTEQIVLRSVPFSLRTLAKGTSAIPVKLIGVIPGPLIFGMIMDKSCIVHDYECGRRLGCLRYDVESISVSILKFALTVNLASFILLLMALLLYQPAGKSPWLKLLIRRVRRKQSGKIHAVEDTATKSEPKLSE